MIPPQKNSIGQYLTVNQFKFRREVNATYVVMKLDHSDEKHETIKSLNGGDTVRKHMKMATPVQVKLMLGAIGGELTAELPFVLMHPK